MFRRVSMILVAIAAVAVLLFAASREASPATATVESAATSTLTVPSVTAAGVVGNYQEAIGEISLAVESNGRIHVVWTGKLNPYFKSFAFYSQSTDGVNWTPWQAIGYDDVTSPILRVDDVRHRVHLMYVNGSYGAIVHRVIADGVMSAPVEIGSGTVPSLAVDPASGYAYAAWQEYVWERSRDDTRDWTSRSLGWYSYWNGAGWTERTRKINNEDVCNVRVAAGPNKTVMLAWLQDCTYMTGSGQDAGHESVLRTAYSTDGDDFSLRQEAGGYALPQKDAAFVLGYSASDNKFHITTYHMMWPGHSIVNAFTWTGSWSSPINVSENPQDWAVPNYVGSDVYAGAAYYGYVVGSTHYLRSRNGSTLGTPQDLGQYVASKGYTASGYTWYIDASGVKHFLVNGSLNGVNGLYYFK